MPRINPEVISHSLNVDLAHRPIKQKKRHFTSNQVKVVNQEIDKLLEMSFIREVNYPDWLANVVLVKKANEKWWMCVDYTNLNKAFLKDSFPLSRIDQLIDATSEHQLLTFMDAFFGYNQIKMASHDEEKMTFITNRGLYYYKVMPFRLKNVRVTC